MHSFRFIFWHTYKITHKPTSSYRYPLIHRPNVLLPQQATPSARTASKLQDPASNLNTNDPPPPQVRAPHLAETPTPRITPARLRRTAREAVPARAHRRTAVPSDASQAKWCQLDLSALRQGLEASALAVVAMLIPLAAATTLAQRQPQVERRKLAHRHPEAQIKV